MTKKEKEIQRRVAERLGPNYLIPKRDAFFKKNFKMFMKEAFGRVPDEQAYTYIDWKLGKVSDDPGPNKGEPGYQSKTAITEMLEKKVSRNSILDLVRVAQSDIIFDLFQLLEGQWVEKCTWGLYFQDESGAPAYKIMFDELSYNVGDEFLPRETKKEIREKEAKEKLSKKSKPKVSKKAPKKKAASLKTK